MTQAYRWRVAAVVVVGLFMAILDTTIVSVTLPQMQKAFHTDFETITWVASAYFLAQAAVIPIVGYLSDRVGTKLIDLAALALVVGRDPAVRAYQEARARGEEVTPEHLPALSE